MLTLSHWIIDYFHPKGYRIDQQTTDTWWFLIFKQPLSLLFDGRMTEIAADTCILYTPGTRMLYYNLDAGYYHDGILFGGDDAAVLLAQLELPLNTPFTVQNPSEITQLLRDIADERILQQKYTTQIIDLRIRLFLYKLSCAVVKDGEPIYRYARQFYELRKEISRFPERDWRADVLAETLHLSPSRFHHLYKMLLGSTLKQDIIQSRLSQAKQLLRSRNYSVAEISTICGYRNTEHFLRQFKKYMFLPKALPSGLPQPAFFSAGRRRVGCAEHNHCVIANSGIRVL